MEIAVLMACYNRRENSLNCLTHLFAIRNKLDIYLVDDNSTDGTSEIILKQFSEVNIIKGNGNLFWNRGMHLAWEQAARKEYNYYIWLNDDVLLYDNCFIELFECSKLAEDKAIISGIIETHDKSRIIYGGSDKNRKLLIPNDKLQEITFMNGNVVMIPKSVFNILGNLDPVFHHDLGDVDYGLRARKNNLKVLSTRKAIGSGEINEFCRVRQTNTNLVKRFKKLYSPLGSNPNITFYFRKNHFGYLNAMTYYVFIIFINILPDYAVKLLFGNRYR